MYKYLVLIMFTSMRLHAKVIDSVDCENHVISSNSVCVAENYNNLLYRDCFINNNFSYGVQTIQKLYADKFYESTDDPNVWIEHDDEEFDLEDYPV